MRLMPFCLALGVLAPGVVLADDCDTVVAAYRKLADQAAVHQVARMADGSTLEMIAVGDDLYLSGAQGWNKMPGGGAQRRQMMAETLSKDAPPTNCHVVGPETIDGVATTQYSYTPPATEGQPSGDQQVWIGDADGLPHRMRAVAPGGKEMLMALKYDGVVAPPTR